MTAGTSGHDGAGDCGDDHGLVPSLVVDDDAVASAAYSPPGETC
jgi:hypothetical protein